MIQTLYRQDEPGYRVQALLPCQSAPRLLQTAAYLVVPGININQNITINYVSIRTHMYRVKLPKQTDHRPTRPGSPAFFIGIKTLSTHIDGAGTGTSYPVPYNEAVNLKVLI